MSTVVIPFLPSAVSAFQFQVTLDSNLYSCVVTWNLAGQRYYINVYTLSGTLVICSAMVGSPVGYDISLTVNLFTSKLVYRIQNSRFEVIG
jgi:hypothetical protein